VATSGTTVTSTTADLVGRATELLDLVLGKVTNVLALQWVTEVDSTLDLGGINTSVEAAVDGHGTLAVTRDDDLGVGALSESLSDECSHLLAAFCGLVCVTLDTELVYWSYLMLGRIVLTIAEAA
jgi:hypothetical protein